MIFRILTHCLNTTDINNYSIRTKGRWFFEDTVLVGSFPLSPLSSRRLGGGESKDGPNPRITGEVVPGTFYRSLFALVLATLRIGKMSWGGGDGRSRKIVAVGQSIDRVV